MIKKKLLSWLLVLTLVLSSLPAISLSIAEEDSQPLETTQTVVTETPVSNAGALETTAEPTPVPVTPTPTAEPTVTPTVTPTDEPAATPTAEPTDEPTATPTAEPTDEPAATPTAEPTDEPAATPTAEPTDGPTATPTAEPTDEPAATPTAEPTDEPAATPMAEPTDEPAATPTAEPTDEPTATPTTGPTDEPTPTVSPVESSTPSPTSGVDYSASAAASPQFSLGYVECTVRTRVYETETGTQNWLVFPKNVTAYAFGRTASGAKYDRLQIALQTERGVLTGYIAAVNVQPLSPEQTQELIARLLKLSDIAYYRNDQALPLEMADCFFYTDAQVTATLAPTVTKVPMPTPSGAPPESNTETITCTSVSQLQSAHNYDNNMDTTWEYTQPGATSIRVTFSSDTFVESNFDYLYVTSNVIGATTYQMTGSKLAGVTLTLPGNRVKIRLYTDEIVTAYGFRVTDVSAVSTIGTPASVSAKVLSRSGIRLTWNRVSWANRYYVYRSGYPNGTYTRVGSATAATFTDTTTTTRTRLYYIVKAVYSIDTRSFIGSGTAPVMTYVSARPEVSVSGYETGVSLTWQAVPEADGYLIYRSSSTTSGFSYLTRVTALQYRGLGLRWNKTYYYYILPYQDIGSKRYYGTPSSVVSYVRGIGKPSINAIEQTASTSIKVSWSAIDNAVVYYVYRSAGKALSGYEYVGRTTGTGFTDGSVRNAVTYFYKVYAKGFFGGVYATSNASAPAAGIAFTRPVLTSATVNSNAQVILQWRAVTYATHYVIYRATVKNGTYTRMGRVTGTKYVSGVLDTNTYYFYVVPQRSNSTGTFNGLRSTIATCSTTKVEPTYRALLIGQVRYSEGATPRNWADVQTLKAMLNKCTYDGKKYTVTTAQDQTKSQVQALIQSTFRNARSTDVSLFLFAGHGYTNLSGDYAGALVCYNGNHITTATLASWLGAVPGKVIVLLGTCGSGSAIYVDNGKIVANGEDFDAQSFNTAVINSLASYTVTVPNTETNIGELRQSKFYVLTAAAHGEYSWGHEGAYPGNYFAIWMAQGLGYNYATGAWSSSIPADTSGDGKVSLTECYRYIQGIADQTPFTTGGITYYQHQQIYPSGSTFTLFDR